LKYTDGIGKISKDIVEQIRKKHGEQICAIQIRFGGAKGVLVIDENLPNNTIELRKSMVKFDPPGGKYDEEIEILDINKFRGGYLNR
jgi:RNA-dependent RNA polymerase